MNKDDLCHATDSASGETSSAAPLQSGLGEWLPGETLPERQPNSYFPVYLAFSDGKVEMADWAGYETTGSEYHSNGTYLGEYTQDGDSFYMTETGHQVFQDYEGGPWAMEALDDDDKKIRISVVAWMEALMPVPTYPQTGLKSDEVATPSAPQADSQHDTNPSHDG